MTPAADTLTARLLPLTLRRRNRALKPLGLKICCGCQGQAKPLTTEYFYRKGNGWHSECIACLNARSKRNSKRRYQTDPTARRRILARNRAYWFGAQHATVLAVKRATWRRRKAQRFTVLAKFEGAG